MIFAAVLIHDYFTENLTLEDAEIDKLCLLFCFVLQEITVVFYPITVVENLDGGFSASHVQQEGEYSSVQLVRNNPFVLCCITHCIAKQNGKFVTLQDHHYELFLVSSHWWC